MDGKGYVSNELQTYEPLIYVHESTVCEENYIRPSLDAHNFEYAKCAQGLLQVPSTSGGEAPSNFCYRSRKHADFNTPA